MNTHVSTRSRRKAVRALATALCGLAFSSSLGLAQTSGTWTSTTGGNWSDIANWSSGTVATGGNASTNVNANLNTTGTQTITLDTNQTIGSLTFGTGPFTIASSNSSVLTLSGSGGTTSSSRVVTNPFIEGNGTISAVIAGTQGFTYSTGGTRKLNLSGNNTYTGVTTIASGGEIFVSSNNALGATGVGNGTTILYTASSAVQLHFLNNVTVAEDITLQINSSGSTGANLLYNDGGNNTLGGNITLARYSPTATATAGVNTFGVQSTAGTMTISGNISGSTALGQADGSVADQNRLQFRPTATTATVNVTGVISDGTIGTSGLSVYTTDGVGTVRLSGANTYSGSTVHQKGTMLINNTTGSGTGTGSVSVASTAVFGGTGSVAPTGTNSVVFQSGSIVSPGDLNSDGTAIAAGAKLTFALAGTTGGVNFNSGSTISINLNAIASTVAESIAFTGLTIGDASKVTFNGNVVNFSTTGGVIASGLYTIASFDAANAYGGNLLIGTGLEAYTAQLIYTANSIQLQIGAVPEPATVGLLAGIATLGFVVVRRRLKKA